MSTRYPGGVITKTPVVPAGPYENGAAPGIWTLDQQLQAQKAGIWPLAGNVPPYIEDVFSTYLYTGNGSTQTITNGIDLSGKGGLVWFKCRSNVYGNYLFDTLQGATKYLTSNSTGAQLTNATSLTAFNTTGFTMGSASIINGTNTPAETFASWTFREQPKFFDIVTYTGNATSPRTISHNLGSTPGCMIIKRTDTTGDWWVYHRGLGSNNLYLKLNTTAASASSASIWGSGPTNADFTVDAGALNASGGTYVAYLYAHDAGGFGLTGTDNVISCGSFTTDGSGNATVSLGYEPQWVLIKQTDGVDSWYLNDNMRGMAVSGNQPNLSPNLTAAESAGGYNTYPNATGFTASVGIASKAYIYIAIRRGPMRVPTDATKVFKPVLVTSSAADQNVDAGFPVDLVGIGWRNAALGVYFVDRLRGITSSTTPRLAPPSTAAEQLTNNISGAYQTGVTQYTGGSTGYDFVDWFFRRAPGYFDEVCYTGTGSATTVTHNLAAVPELMIVKERNGANGWQVYSASLTNTEYLILNTSAGVPAPSATRWNSTTPTSTVFSVGTHGATNGSGQTFVAYLFATCPGVSKVGSYTGTGTTLQINCGFTAGSRFVLIKRTDSTGDWYVWDSARGIVAGNDPYLLLNSTAAEVTGTDYVDTYSAGFEISSTAPAAINANGGSYIFLAIA